MRAIQSLIFSRKHFTRAQALLWAKKHGHKAYTSRLTPHQVRIRQFPLTHAKKFVGTFNLGKNIKAVYAERGF
jgi:hypothetical protein